MGGKRIAYGTGWNAAGGPTEEAWRAYASLIRRAFATSHARVKDSYASCAAIVGGQIDDERVVLDSPFANLFQEQPEVGVDVFDHPKEFGRLLAHIGLVQI